MLLTTDNPIPKIFNYNRLRLHRARAAENFAEHDFLFRESAERLCDRLSCFKDKFPVALDLGSRTGIIAETLRGRGGIESLIQLEQSETMLHKAREVRVVGSEEALPFAANSFDLVISNCALHNINDFPGTLAQIKNTLKPDGLLIAGFFGGSTLHELRNCLEQAEIEACGGVSPRVSPFIDVKTAGDLMQRAGFTLPVVDSEMLTVKYSHPLKLLKELRGTGESNCLNESRKTFTPCSLIMSAIDKYFRNFCDEDNTIRASFELITVTGRKPLRI